MAKGNDMSVIVAGLLLAILMASMDNTIVATAIGTIVGELGGFDKLCGLPPRSGRRDGRDADFW